MRPEILFLPVDERFCTRDYFLLLSEAGGIKVSTPPVSLLGAKKIPPDMKRLHNWIERHAQSCELLILSLDMLVHGGLIPSRMSLESLETLSRRLDFVTTLQGPSHKVYASISVTRTPFYDSAEEEPDYWEYYGKQIYDLSRLMARQSRGEAVGALLEEQRSMIPSWIVRDYSARRERNYEVVIRALDLVAEGSIDFLNLVLDDNSQESLSLAEAERHSTRVASLGITDRVSIHAGADESTLTLLSKALVDQHEMSPSFRVIYTSPTSRSFIPPYEGAPLFEGVKNHLEAAGGWQVESDEDIALLVNNPDAAIESPMQPACPEDPAVYDIAIEVIQQHNDKIVGVADVRYVNGADNYLAKLLLGQSSIDWNRANFAAWNTAGNTLGTVCAYSIIQYLGAEGVLNLDTRKMALLQAIFFLEHWAFQANVRTDLIQAAQEKEVLPWTVMPVEEWAIEYTTRKLGAYKDAIEKAVTTHWKTFEVWFPWHRSFEIGISLD